MKTIRQLLDAKGHEVYSVAPGTSVYDAIALMAEKGVGALLVLDGERIRGIISERDYARKVILQGRSSKATRVADIMTTSVIYAPADETVQNCLALMTEKRIRHLPIMEEGRLAGMVSIGDLVKAVIDEQRFTIEQLERYITS